MNRSKGGLWVCDGLDPGVEVRDKKSLPEVADFVLVL